MRTVLAAAVVATLLAAPGCTGGGEKSEPGADDVDTILAATSNIVFQCRAVERGFTTIDEEALDRDVDALVEAAEELDPEATFRRPQLLEPDEPLGDEAELVDPETSLREQAELALARLEDESCSPQDAERLRDALGE
ncbi:MAG TPA: hypothetical protein VD769_15210 [Gaiellaceae bacterium]|nr:hypothetical protein [Gaiellaceae bacterium]